jgi:hypothetical protein
VTSRLTRSFRKCFAELPEAIQEQARRSYEQWRENPHHPSLYFKRVHPTEPIYSARVALGWRALGLLEGDTVTWFWIGSHGDYDKLLTRSGHLGLDIRDRA